MRRRAGGDALRDRRRREVRVHARHLGHHRGVRDVEALEPEHAALGVDDRADRARPGRVEEPARARPGVLLGRDLGPGPQFTSGQPRDLRARGERANVGDPLGEHLGVDRVGEEAVVDDGRHARVLGGEPHRAARTRPHHEGRGARLEPTVRSLLERCDVEQVPQAGLAAARPRPDRDLSHEHGVLGREARRLALQHGGRLESEPDADMVLEAESERQCGIEAAPQEDRGRAVRARSDHDGARPHLAALGCQPHGPTGLDEHAVDERVAADREIRPRSRRIEIREPRVPASCAAHVRGVDDGVVAGRVRERAVPGRDLLHGERSRREDRLRALEERRDLGVAPAGAPRLEVLGRWAQEDARVVRRAAADHACAELRAVLAGGLPGVRERERPRVEQVGGPPAALERAVVRPRLDEADGARRVLREPRGEHTARGPTARDRHVVRHARRIRRGSRGSAVGAGYDRPSGTRATRRRFDE
jgi:hypothetical protein